MKESANLNTKEKIATAFKILKKEYPHAELFYSSTDNFYWHFAYLYKNVLYHHTIRELINNNIEFAVMAHKNSIELEL